MLTGGHCFPQTGSNDFMWIFSGTSTKEEYAGKRVYSSWSSGTGSVPVGTPSDYHGDVSLVNVSDAGNAAGSQIWWDSVSTKIPVTERHAPALNDDLCFSGFVSGADCGVYVILVNQNDVNLYDGSTYLGRARRVDLSYSEYSYDCPQTGDSGAPVVLNHPGAESFADAKGIVSGFFTGDWDGDSDPDCVMVSTGVEEAVQAWGGDLDFN